MGTRIVALAAIFVAVAAVGPSGRVEAAACGQITDRAGDAMDQAGPNPSLDILSADLASDATTITGVVRVKELAETSPTTPQSRNYYLLFSTDKPPVRMFLLATLYQGGVARFGWGTVAPTDPLGLLVLYDDGFGVVNRGEGFLDLAKNEVHISALVSDVAAKGNVKPGSKLSKLQADTFYAIGTFIFEADTAAGKGHYVAGAASCVVPGK
jgi:hypothetical protein